MCGRYAATARPDELVEEFEVDVDRTGDPSRSILAHPQNPPPGEPDYNMAPTKQAPVVLTRAAKPSADAAGAGSTADPSTVGAEPGALTRQLRLLTWGLVPSWSKDVKGGARMINARAETLLEKRSFARAATSRRCIVPARGWYEWQASPTAVDAKGKPRKQPFFTTRADGGSVGFGGIYEFWRDRTIDDPDAVDAWLVTFAIVTTAAEPGLDRIHDRQPLVLDPDDWADWLDPGLTDPADVLPFLAPREPGRFTAYPVSRAVSSNRSNGSHLLDPADPAELLGVVDPMTGEVIGG